MYLLQQCEVTAATPSLVFPHIPVSAHLLLRGWLRGTKPDYEDGYGLQLNGDTGLHYSGAIWQVYGGGLNAFENRLQDRLYGLGMPAAWAAPQHRGRLVCHIEQPPAGYVMVHGTGGYAVGGTGGTIQDGHFSGTWEQAPVVPVHTITLLAGTGQWAPGTTVALYAVTEAEA